MRRCARPCCPTSVDFLIITTLIGGTVGGYITYAGAHRLVDSGITGPEHVRDITRGSVTGILVTGVMRTLLFLAVLGVVAGGVTLAADNPPASAFQAALGDVGVRVFGIILWAASITSVIGASYTSVSFLAGFSRAPRGAPQPGDRRLHRLLGRDLPRAGQGARSRCSSSPAPSTGSSSRSASPIILWVAARRIDLLRGYRYPKWLLADRRARVGAHRLPRLELPRRHRGPAVTAAAASTSTPTWASRSAAGPSATTTPCSR